MHGTRRTLLGVALLLGGSVAAGLVALAPAVPVAAGAGLGVVLVTAGLWLVVTALRRRLDGLRLSVQADPELADLVARRYGDDSVRAWDLLTVAASAPTADVDRLRATVRAAGDLDDLAARLDRAQ